MSDLQVFRDNGDISFTGKPLTGAALLSQRLLIILLTNVDELLREQEGTLIPSLFYDGANGYEDSTIQNLLAIATAKTVEYYNDTLTEDTPDTERIASYVVDHFSRVLDTIEIAMTLTTAAGETYTMEGAL